MEKIQKSLFGEQAEPADEKNHLQLPRESVFRRTNAVVLCIISICVLAVYFIFNIWDGNFGGLPVLALSAVIPGICIVWLRFREEPMLPMLVIGLNLLALAIYKLLFGSGEDGSYLLWYLIFPPLVVWCMGRALGSLIFGIYFAVVVALMCTPLDVFLSSDFPTPLRARFIVANLVGFTVFWVLEYVRCQAHLSLEHSLDRLEHFAYTDSLTGLGNRRDFQTHLNWLRAQAKRTGGNFSIALADLDHFKRVNDTHGHHVGDLVLKHVSETISSSLRETDRLFRWGGEEFALLMPNTTLADAAGVAERVRINLEDSVYMHEGVPVPVTVSLGVESWAGDKDAVRMLAMADTRLYMAKKLGRNRVCADLPLVDDNCLGAAKGSLHTMLDEF